MKLWVTGLAYALTVAVTVVPSVARAHGLDEDGDGIDDGLEQTLIDAFHPQFWLDTRECDERPASFLRGAHDPLAHERDGTIYAKVSPSRALGPDRESVEIHYYHLWRRDCGNLSPHDLDVEHVSGLLASVDGQWRARYWYAAAHEDTICDTSQAARAEALRAVTRGPSVWISAGKHASYFSYDLCRQRGCGVDDCGEMVAFHPLRVVNIGERNAPLNGSMWIASNEWPLFKKLASDFDAELLTALDQSGDALIARVNGQWRGTHITLSVGGDLLDAFGKAGRHGGGSLLRAETETESALGKTFRALGRALVHVARALGLAGDEE